MSLTKTPFYKIRTLYSITFNPNDAHQGTLKEGVLKRIATFKQNIWEVIRTHPKILYLLHVDISEPKNINPSYPRLHLHGVIMFYDTDAIRHWLLDCLFRFKAWCNIDIDTIGDIAVWHKYCTKYDHITMVSPLQNKLEWDNILKNSVSREDVSESAISTEINK